MSNDTKKENCTCQYESGHSFACPLYVPSKNPMEVKEGTNCPPLEEKKECKHNKGNYAKNGFLFCDNCDEVVSHPSIQEDKDWATEFEEQFPMLNGVKVTPHSGDDFKKAKILQEYWNNIEKNLKSFIKKTKQESYEEGKAKERVRSALIVEELMEDSEHWQPIAGRILERIIINKDDIINSLKKD